MNYCVNSKAPETVIDSASSQSKASETVIDKASNIKTLKNHKNKSLIKIIAMRMRKKKKKKRYVQQHVDYNFCEGGVE